METKPESVIPKGPYCYDENGYCPYHKTDETRPSQENGYCEFLEIGDWGRNAIPSWRRVQDDGSEGELESAEDIGLPMSLLWDAVKECGINDNWEDFEGENDGN